MTHFVSRTKEIFFPQPPKELDFKGAVAAIDTQRISRIAKSAIFAFSTALSTVTMILSEASIIAWPIILPLVAISVVAFGVFYRLNSLDKKYVSGLDDAKRTSLVQTEIEKVFHGKEKMDDVEVTKSLKGINQILGNVVFNDNFIKSILATNAEKTTSEKSIAEIIVEKKQEKMMNFSCTSEWVEKGGFGLPAYKYTFTVKWSPVPLETKVEYQCVEEKKKT
jgi:hypothetical protein